ncbi:MAG: hypothetical protein HQL63_04410 [Magnetococcales bacterium]|nr:hypothetical protein [Magnetococcales bacterium]MBF0321741.1 hypothetical protein [Magnetococcales bacterium]
MSVFDFVTPDDVANALGSATDRPWARGTSFAAFCRWVWENHQKYTAFDDRQRYEYRTGLREPEDDQIQAMLQDYLRTAT